MIHRFIATALAVVLCLAGAAPPVEWQPALDHISADSLRGHLSFLASDLLEGRATPSRGLDIAAEYIAAQFRRAGLEAAGDDGYFQTADMLEIEQDREGVEARFQRGDQTIRLSGDQLGVRGAGAVEVTDAPVFTLHASGSASLKPEQARGRALVVAGGRGFRAVLPALQKLEPAAIVIPPRAVREYAPSPQLIDAQDRPRGAPVIFLNRLDAAAKKAIDELKPGPSDWKLSLRIPAPREKAVKARNVIGLLRGSDPALKDTYVLLTAHYDHMGRETSGERRVFNGANDDGSGTVSVIEIGAALASLPRHPKRSIVFLAVFGEELGMVGSQYYARHPIFPLRKTVADINLEQVGRTDSSLGPEIANLTFTGFEFSDLPAVFRKAGEMTGVKVYEGQNGGDEYFARSDNVSFAAHGIPAHTVVVAYEFPDYHAVGDVWTKIDYGNMAKVDRALALGLLLVADNPRAPHWNTENPKTERYAEAAGR